MILVGFHFSSFREFFGSGTDPISLLTMFVLLLFLLLGRSLTVKA